MKNVLLHGQHDFYKKKSKVKSLQARFNPVKCHHRHMVYCALYAREHVIPRPNTIQPFTILAF